MLWIGLGILVLVLGVYREHLYREKDRQQEETHQQKMIKKLNALDSKLGSLVEDGTITRETSKEIKNIFLHVSDTISLKDEVEFKIIRGEGKNQN